MSGLCLAAGALATVLATDAFTLSWTHSVEKVEWQEDYSVVDGALVLQEARIKGSGAGMEAAADAVWHEGWWRYQPAASSFDVLRLTHSRFTADYRLCWSGSCRSIGEILPGLADAAVIELRPCGSDL